MSKIGSTQQKILLLLLGGLALGLSRSPKQYFKIIHGMQREWNRISQQSLRRAIASLYRSKLIAMQEKPDGTVTLIITEDGERRALAYNVDSMRIAPPTKWDCLWRLVVSDIPETKKRAREAFRLHLKKLGFVQLQKSVYIHPFDCKNEIEFLIELHGLRRYVRVLVVQTIDNELYLCTHFNLKLPPNTHSKKTGR